MLPPHPLKVGGSSRVSSREEWRARRDLNPRLSAPEADALSAELRARCPELLHDAAVHILNYISVPKRKQQTRRSTGVIGFRNATLVDPRGRIVAYADRFAIGASAIGLSSATFAPSMLPRLLGGRMPPVTVLQAGGPPPRPDRVPLSPPSPRPRRFS